VHAFTKKVLVKELHCLKANQVSVSYFMVEDDVAVVLFKAKKYPHISMQS